MFDRWISQRQLKRSAWLLFLAHPLQNHSRVTRPFKKKKNVIAGRSVGLQDTWRTLRQSAVDDSHRRIYVRLGLLLARDKSVLCPVKVKAVKIRNDHKSRLSLLLATSAIPQFTRLQDFNGQKPLEILRHQRDFACGKVGGAKDGGLQILFRLGGRSFAMRPSQLQRFRSPSLFSLPPFPIQVPTIGWGCLPASPGLGCGRAVR